MAGQADETELVEIIVEAWGQVKDGAVTSMTVSSSARASAEPACGMRAARVTDAKGTTKRVERNMLSRWIGVHAQENMAYIQAPYTLPRGNSYILPVPNVF